MTALLETIHRIDFTILDWIYENLTNPFLDQLMPLITYLGDHGLFFILLALVLACSKKYRQLGFMIGVSLLLGFIFGNIILKPLIGRIRPYDINTSVNLLINVLSDFSFPSGHTLVAFETATVLMIFNKKVGIPALILAFSIAFSRLYLYVHFPSDVIIGALLGTLFGYIGYHFVRFIYRKLKETPSD